MSGDLVLRRRPIRATSQCLCPSSPPCACAWAVASAVPCNFCLVKCDPNPGRDPEEQKLLIRVFDYDALKSDDPLGVAYLPASVLCKGEAQTYTLELTGDGGGGSITFYAEYFPFTGAPHGLAALLQPTGSGEIVGSTRDPAGTAAGNCVQGYCQ